MTAVMNMDFLLLYIREDGMFLRLIQDGEESGEWNEEIRTEVSESTLRHSIVTLFLRLEKRVPFTGRLTVVFALSRKVEVLRSSVYEILRGFRFADSVSVLKRAEIFFLAAKLLSREHPRQVLFCDSRETRLFSENGEFLLQSPGSTGNGFLDWVLGFAQNDEDASDYFLEQTDRLSELFRAYRCFTPVSRRSDSIFPSRTAYPDLSVRPQYTGDFAFFRKSDPAVKKRQNSAFEEEEAPPPIDYRALSPAEKSRVDRKYPAFYRVARDSTVSIEEAAATFEALFGEIKTAPLTDLVVVGQYAHFPLTEDFLGALPQKPRISYESESKLVLDGMAEAVSERIRSSRLSIRDMDGEEIVLWDEAPSEAEGCREKRVCFAVTLKENISKEELRQRKQQQPHSPALEMPYFLSMEEWKRDPDGTFRRNRISRTGDLKDFCYKRQKDGSYRLRFPEKGEAQSAFRTVLLGLGATPNGICCHILSDNGEETK